MDNIEIQATINGIPLVDEFTYASSIKPVVEKINNLITDGNIEGLRTILKLSPDYEKLLLLNPVWVRGVNYDDQDIKDSSLGYFSPKKKPLIVLDKMPKTPLMTACACANVPILHELFSVAGIDINAKTEDGEHAINFAIRGSNNSVRRTLVSHPDLDLYGVCQLTADIIGAKTLVPLDLVHILMSRNDFIISGKEKELNIKALETYIANNSKSDTNYKYYVMLLGLFRAKERGIINWTKKTGPRPVKWLD